MRIYTSTLTLFLLLPFSLSAMDGFVRLMSSLSGSEKDQHEERLSLTPILYELKHASPLALEHAECDKKITAFLSSNIETIAHIYKTNPTLLEQPDWQLLANWMGAKLGSWGYNVGCVSTPIYCTGACKVKKLTNTQIVIGRMNGSVMVYDITLKKSVLEYKIASTPIADIVLIDNNRFACSVVDGPIIIVNRATGERLQTMNGIKGGSEPLELVDDQRIISGNSNGTLTIWDIRTGKIVTVLNGHTNGINAIIKINSTTLASASSDGTIRLWDVANYMCKSVLQGHTDSVTCLSRYGKDHFVSGSVDTTIRLWDAASGSCTTVLSGYDNPIRCVAEQQSDDRTIVISGDDEKTVVVWSNPLHRGYKEHNGSINSVASLNKDCFVSTSTEGARVWRIKPTLIDLLTKLEQIMALSPVLNNPAAQGAAFKELFTHPLASYIIPLLARYYNNLQQGSLSSTDFVSLVDSLIKSVANKSEQRQCHILYSMLRYARYLRLERVEPIIRYAFSTFKPMLTGKECEDLPKDLLSYGILKLITADENGILFSQDVAALSPYLAKKCVATDTISCKQDNAAIAFVKSLMYLDYLCSQAARTRARFNIQDMQIALNETPLPMSAILLAHTWQLPHYAYAFTQRLLGETNPVELHELITQLPPPCQLYAVPFLQPTPALDGWLLTRYEQAILMHNAYRKNVKDSAFATAESDAIDFLFPRLQSFFEAKHGAHFKQSMVTNILIGHPDENKDHLEKLTVAELVLYKKQ